MYARELKVGSRVVWGTGANKRRGRVVGTDPLRIKWESDGTTSEVDPKYLRLSKNQRGGKLAKEFGAK